MYSIVKLKNRIKQKEGMAKMQFVKQMDQKYEEVLHSATRLGQACGHRLLYTSTQSKIHETKILIRVPKF